MIQKSENLQDTRPFLRCLPKQVLYLFTSLTNHLEFSFISKFFVEEVQEVPQFVVFLKEIDKVVPVLQRLLLQEIKDTSGLLLNFLTYIDPGDRIFRTDCVSFLVASGN